MWGWVAGMMRHLCEKHWQRTGVQERGSYLLVAYRTGLSSLQTRWGESFVSDYSTQFFFSFQTTPKQTKKAKKVTVWYFFQKKRDKLKQKKTNPVNWPLLQTQDPSQPLICPQYTFWISDHVRHFSNWYDWCKMVKVVHGNQSHNHCNRPET